jgi:hypothetical protein
MYGIALTAEERDLLAKAVRAYVGRGGGRVSGKALLEMIENAAELGSFGAMHYDPRTDASHRAIGGALGVSKSQAERDVADAGVPVGTPDLPEQTTGMRDLKEPGVAPATPGLPDRITGLDGKEPAL